jgi:hypothetical protein
LAHFVKRIVALPITDISCRCKGLTISRLNVNVFVKGLDKPLMTFVFALALSWRRFPHWLLRLSVERMLNHPLLNDEARRPQYTSILYVLYPHLHIWPWRR